MKHPYILLLIFLHAIISAPAICADDYSASQTTPYYITVSTTERMQGVKTTGAQIEVGKSVAEKAQLSPMDIANLKKYRFPSLTDAVNYLTPYGWRLDQTYVTHTGTQATTIVWVLRKDVKKPLELSEGLSIDE